MDIDPKIILTILMGTLEWDMFTNVYGFLAILTFTTDGGGNVILSKVWDYYGVVSSSISALGLMCHASNARNKVKLQAYQLECTLIVRLQAVDPRCTPNMMEEEEKAREYFEETKDILQLFCPSVWMDKFQEHVEDFVQQHLSAAEIITTVLLMAEEDYVHLHGLCCLVAGAIQEGELVQLSTYATTCAKLD
ncbi:hypothetical protein V8E53_002608 [Lactarius tabidus]